MSRISSFFSKPLLVLAFIFVGTTVTEASSKVFGMEGATYSMVDNSEFEEDGKMYAVVRATVQSQSEEEDFTQEKEFEVRGSHSKYAYHDGELYATDVFSVSRFMLNEERTPLASHIFNRTEQYGYEALGETTLRTALEDGWEAVFKGTRFQRPFEGGEFVLEDEQQNDERVREQRTKEASLNFSICVREWDEFSGFKKKKRHSLKQYDGYKVSKVTEHRIPGETEISRTETKELEPGGIYTTTTEAPECASGQKLRELNPL
ncbi:MAG: hypothetical protein HOI80_01745 [Alphaproteobacteria bacterium]|nr:hypothetical protein [Alphaproteobacteria bacterium]MBT5390026.1 hypothetical protein [Alphaproteobacteria bacterium]MBT5654207.1 hypothetical protein [Alphaproteobacteria bacterium]